LNNRPAIPSPVIAFIFARGGSKGLPRKNVLPFAGKPLIAHAIQTARASELVDRVVVSTEDYEIAAIARDWGAEVPFVRPAALAADNASEFLAWKHAISAVQGAGDQVGTFVSLPATSPLRNVDDVNGTILRLYEGDADLILTVSPARRHPMYNMVILDEEGFVRIATPPPANLHRRQDAPPMYDVGTVAYAARPAFILTAPSLLAGRTKVYVVPPERAIDIDDELDFAMAEFLFKRRQTS
jgi:CMP-N-acetylneuraminic acid synthetase